MSPRPIEPGPRLRAVGWRRGRVGWLAVLGFAALAGGIAVNVALGTGSWVGVAVYAAPGVALAAVMLTVGGSLPRWRVDADGVALWGRSGSVELAWEEVRAVGFSHGLATEGLRLIGYRCRWHLEIYPVGALPGGTAELYATTEPPARPDLPTPYLAFGCPGGGQDVALARAMQRHAPQAWLGVDARWDRPTAADAG